MDIKKLDEALRHYLAGNRLKNDGAKIERDSLKVITREFGEGKEPYTLAISNTLDLVVRYGSKEAEEIDPKKLFEDNPEKFWELCSVPITNAIEVLGAKDAAKYTRVVKKTALKVEKVKHGG